MIRRLAEYCSSNSWGEPVRTGSVTGQGHWHCARCARLGEFDCSIRVTEEQSHGGRLVYLIDELYYSGVHCTQCDARAKRAKFAWALLCLKRLCFFLEQKRPVIELINTSTESDRAAGVIRAECTFDFDRFIGPINL